MTNGEYNNLILYIILVLLLYTECYIIKFIV